MQNQDVDVKARWGGDPITGLVEKSWDELFSYDQAELETLQLTYANERLQQLLPEIRVLRTQAELAGITEVASFEDISALLFQHTAYKSYPISLLEKNRFSQLTEWLDGLTSVDLSGVDATRCGGIDDWLETLETQSALQPYHTSGTSGKLSFFPRSVVERDLWHACYLKKFTGFGGDPSTLLGGKNLRLPVVYPSLRHGRYASQRLLKFLSEYVAPSPEQCYTLTDGTLSADLVSLSGRIRVAQAKGDVKSLQLSDSMKVAMKRYMAEQEERPKQTAAFFERMIEGLKGRRVLLSSQTSYLYQASEAAAKSGLFEVFAPNSLISFGGGGKDVKLPPDWKERIYHFTGARKLTSNYGMTELSDHMALCPSGHYHPAPYSVTILRDPETGALLPRQGTQTGQFGCLDLLPQTYWGGILSGDKVTISWDVPCTCGHKGPYIHDTVSRYSAAVTGDDKITCSETVDNTDAMLQALLGS